MPCPNGNPLHCGIASSAVRSDADHPKSLALARRDGLNSHFAPIGWSQGVESLAVDEGSFVVLVASSYPVVDSIFPNDLRRYPHSAYSDGPLAAAFESRPHRTRVVWIILRRASQTIAFGNRPRGLALPNFDRLKRGSFYASSALPPSDSTEISMPSLILGERLLDVSPDGPNDLRVNKASRAEPVAWSSLPNVFDAARDLGFSTALVDCFNDIVTN